MSASRNEPKLPATLPARPCDEDRDLFRDSVGEDEMYRGHNGDCMNCGAEYSEADDCDLHTAHWMHCTAVARALWDRDEPADVRELAAVMDPDDPMDATVHARALLASTTVEWGLRIEHPRYEGYTSAVTSEQQADYLGRAIASDSDHTAIKLRRRVTAWQDATGAGTDLTPHEGENHV